MLFAAAWVLGAFVAASPSPYAALRALLLAVACATLLLALGRVALGSWARGALAATAIVIFVTQGREAATIVDNAVRALAWWQGLVLGLLVVAAAAAGAYVLRASLQAADLAGRTSRYLNLVALVLLVLIVGNGVARGSFSVEDLRQGASLDQANTADAPRAGPDIYVILLDGYPRADTLAQSYDFDNTGFVRELEQRGFWVDAASHSNYMMTELSFQSIFNLSLIDQIPRLQPVLDGQAPAEPTARRLLNDNRLFAELRSRGYEVVTNSIPFEDPALRGSDLFVDLGGVNEFERKLVASSFLLDATDLFNRNAMADDIRNQVTAALDAVPEVAADRKIGPRFMFAHVLAPHGPFLFDAQGNAVTSGLPHRHEDRIGPDDLTQAQFSQLLVGEVAYLNQAVLDAVDGVLAASPDPPVIILMSDHGVRATTIDPSDIAPGQVRDVFGNLFAVYTPGREIYAEGTAVSEVMPLLLNAYFDAQLPIPGAETFVSPGNDPFSITQVPPPSPPDS